MGVSTNGEISFGIIFEEGYEFPWDKFDDGLEEWWLYEVHQLKHSKQLFDEEGNYLNDRKCTDDEYAVYKAEQEAVMKEHPLPVQLVNYCSGDYPAYILAIPDFGANCHRGDPTELDISILRPDADDVKDLIDFCKRFNLEYEEGPKLYLSSYWG